MRGYSVRVIRLEWLAHSTSKNGCIFSGLKLLFQYFPITVEFMTIPSKSGADTFTHSSTSCKRLMTDTVGRQQGFDQGQLLATLNRQQSASKGIEPTRKRHLESENAAAAAVDQPDPAHHQASHRHMLIAAADCFSSLFRPGDRSSQSVSTAACCIVLDRHDLSPDIPHVSR